MKRIPLALLAATALIVSFSSCDKHPWSETQVLHEGMHKAHGEEHHHEGKGVDHAKPEHTESPAPAAEKKAH